MEDLSKYEGLIWSAVRSARPMFRNFALYADETDLFEEAVVVFYECQQTSDTRSSCYDPSMGSFDRFLITCIQKRFDRIRERQMGRRIPEMYQGFGEAPTGPATFDPTVRETALSILDCLDQKDSRFVSFCETQNGATLRLCLQKYLSLSRSDYEKAWGVLLVDYRPQVEPYLKEHGSYLAYGSYWHLGTNVIADRSAKPTQVVGHKAHEKILVDGLSEIATKYLQCIIEPPQEFLDYCSKQKTPRLSTLIRRFLKLSNASVSRVYKEIQEAVGKVGGENLKERMLLLQ